MTPPRLARVAAAYLDEDEACALLHEHGCLVVTGAVPKEACASAREYVDARLALALAACGSASTAFPPPGYLSDTEEHVDAATYHFGNVLSPPNRRDLKLPLDPPVRACLLPALRALAPVLANILTTDAELVELASLVADPGAAEQRLHPDTPITNTGFGMHCCLITAFIALQDVVDSKMGATQVCPGTHCAEAHAALNDASMRDEATKEARLNAAGFGAPLPALLGVGDCLLMDSRCIHRGGANADTRGRRRALMYASFAVPYNVPGGSTYSLLPDLESGARKRVSAIEAWCG